MKLVEKIEKFENEIDLIIKKYINEDVQFPVELTLIHVLERTQFSLHSLNLLLQGNIGKKEHSIGLICRNLLTDFITISYIINKADSEEELYVNLYSLHLSDIKKTEASIEFFKGNEKLTDKEYLNAIDKLNNPKGIYKFIKDYASDYKLKLLPQTAQMIDWFLKNHNEDPWRKSVADSYDPWLFYSKYEHLGWFSYELTRKITEQKTRTLVESVIDKVPFMIKGCLIELENHKNS